MIQECLQYNYNDTEPCPGSYKNCTKQITCPSHLKHHCFVVWKNESSEVSLVGAGCNPPYDSSPNETCNSECIGSPRGPRFYCCCTGNLCNKNFRLPDGLLELPQPRQSQDVEVKISAEPDHSSGTWLLVPLVLIITIIIASIYRYKRKINEQNRNIDPGINPLDYIQDHRRAKPANEHLTERELNELRNNGGTSILAPLRSQFNGDHVLANNSNIDSDFNSSAYQLQNSFHTHPLHHRLNQLSSQNQQHRALLQSTNHDSPDANKFNALNGFHRDKAEALHLNALGENNLPVIDLNSIELLEVVGRGRFGEVRKAKIRGTSSEIAVKIIAPNDQQSWSNEIQIYTFYRVKHQNVLNFIDAMEHVETESYWLLVEYAPNGSLYGFLKHNLLDWHSFRKIALGIVHGLSHLHEADVAHRDFKSKNVLLKRDLTPCITDFGVATILDSRSGSQIDQKKKFLQVGTPRYMAPEVLECSVTFTKASFTKIDVYALSLVLWELLSRCNTVNRPTSRVAQTEFNLEYNNNRNNNNNCNMQQQAATTANSSHTSNAVETSTYLHPNSLTDAPLPPQFLSSSPSSSSSSSSSSSFGQTIIDPPSIVEKISSNGANHFVRMTEIESQQKQQVDAHQQPIAITNEINYIEPFRLPFQDLVGTNPDIEIMRQVVVVEKLRPQIKDHWRDTPTAVYCRAIEDGWEYDYDARISASCFVERLESLPTGVL